jgi:hypothetical protein
MVATHQEMLQLLDEMEQRLRTPIPHKNVDYWILTGMLTTTGADAYRLGLDQALKTTEGYLDAISTVRRLVRHHAAVVIKRKMTE